MTEELPFCECGECGLRVAKKGNRFIRGHNKGRLGKKNSPEACAKMSISHTDVPLSPEHSFTALKGREESGMYEAMRGVPRPPEDCAAISAATLGVPKSPKHCAAIKNSDAHKAESDRQRSGNDFVTHHWLYDHSDLSKNTIKMTRSHHSWLHALFRKFGYIVPHINMKGESA